MPDLATWGIAAAFAGGLVSFFSPCTLPLVPGYLSVVTGGALTEASNRLKAFWLSLCFVMGFSLVFVALGASASVLGQWLMAYREEANLVAGVLIVLMGLFMLGWWSMPALQRDWRIGQSLEGGRPTAAFLLGIAFAIGWTPCIGPILGSILALAAIEENVSKSILLLSFYSLGLAIPFIISGILIDKFLFFSKSLKKYISSITKIGGFILLLTGIAILTGQLQVLGFFILKYFPLLGNIG